MLRGIDSFIEYFKNYGDEYTIIGGTACDLLMSDYGLSFRTTKDIDLVLIVESISADFVRDFWRYVRVAGYEHRNKSDGKVQFYRFSNPISKEYPAMIELFSRNPERISLSDKAVITPLPFDEDTSSLSAILLNDDYYNFLKAGRVQLSGLTILSAPYLIPFKAKAWLDLSEKRQNGLNVDSKNIRKHKNDVFRLTELLNHNRKTVEGLSVEITNDMSLFCSRIALEDIDLKQLGIQNRSKDEIISELRALYCC